MSLYIYQAVKQLFLLNILINLSTINHHQSPFSYLLSYQLLYQTEHILYTLLREWGYYWCHLQTIFPPFLYN